MAAPPKPWESSRLSDSAFLQPSGDVAPPFVSIGAPAPPPRPYPNRSATGPQAAFGSPYGYGSYGGYGYNSYNSYNSFGPYGYGNFCGGLNRYGGNAFGDVESRFVQLAEESTRPTFQSIESIVGAVGSVATMLENTFLAMTSSFRAILGVAENFGRLRTLFSQFWSAFAVFRAFNWLLRRLSVLAGFRTQEEFRAWAEATRSADASATGPGRERTNSWPALLFLAVIGAVPYIIVRMLGSINATVDSNASDPSTWENPMRALAQYDFTASSPREISFKAHQIITLAPQSVQGSLWNSGWLLATVDNRNTGLVPVNYFKIIRDSDPAEGLCVNNETK